MCLGGGMVDTLALGASAARREGSSPFPGTKKNTPYFLPLTSVPSQKIWGILFGAEGREDENREGGRGNGSFPVLEGSSVAARETGGFPGSKSRNIC